MTAFNIVRFRVKPGREQEFLAAHQKAERFFPGMRRFIMVKTGERAYCVMAEWASFDKIVAARPSMIGILDSFRDTLEDLGGGLGVTDPVAGTVVMEKKPPAKKSKAKKPAKKAAPKAARKRRRKRNQSAGNDPRLRSGCGRTCRSWAGLARGLFFLYLGMLVVWGSQPDARGQLVAAIGIAIASVAGVMALGLSRVLLFLAIVLPVTLGIENIGVATGFPFGHYHFQASQFSLWVGRVPLLVGMLYFGVGLLCWLIAEILLDGRGQTALRPIIAAGLMVLWDLVMDPGFSTIGQVWVWHEGGAFFGVPLSNFAGWFLTTWIMFQLFAAALRRMPGREPRGGALHPRGLRPYFYIWASACRRWFRFSPRPMQA